MLFLSFPAKHQKTMEKKSILKTPAEFNLNKSVKNVSIDKDLKSPMNFVQSEKDIGNKASAMKKPSDFTLATEINPRIDKSRDLNVNLMKCQKISEKLQHDQPKKSDDFNELFYKENIVKLQEKLKEKDVQIEKLNLEFLKSNQEHKQTIDLLTKKLNEAEFNFQMLTTEHTTKDSKYFLEVKSVYEKYISLQQKFESEKANLSSKIVNLEEDVLQAQSENKVLNELLGQSNFKIDILKEELGKINNNYSEIYATFHDKQSNDKNEIRNLENRVYDLEDTNNELTKQNEKLQQQIVLNTENATSLKSELDEKTSLIASKDDEIISLMQQNDSTFQKNKILEKRIKDLCNELDAEKEHVKLMSQKFANLEKEISTLNQMWDSSKYELANKTKDLMELEKTCQTLQSSNKQFSLRVDTLNNMFAMQEKELNHNKINQSEKLICLWRQKVYQLLVQLKSKEMEEF